MKKKTLLFILFFGLVLCLVGCVSTNTKSTYENIWVEEGFKLNEGDLVYIYSTERDRQHLFTIENTVANAFVKAGLIAKVKDALIVTDLDEIVPSETGRTFFVDCKAVEDINRGYYTYYNSEMYSLFEVHIYDYKTKNMVASNLCEEKQLGMGAVSDLHIYYSMINLLNRIK